MSIKRSEQPELMGVRVLVVEDHEDLRELLQAVLELSKMIVFTAASASEALALLHAEQVHIIVSDIGMPEEDGCDFIRRVRSSQVHEIASLPAVAVTAYVSAQDRARALRAGFNAYMTKPYDVEQLITALAKLMSTRDRCSP